MKQASYALNHKLDIELNMVLERPEIDRPQIGYKALEKQVAVTIRADNLKTPIIVLHVENTGFCLF